MQSHSLSTVFSTNAESTVLCLASDREGGQIAVGTSASCLVLDAKAGGSVIHAERDSGPVTALSFGRNGRLVVGAQGALRLWDIKLGKVVKSLELCDASSEQQREDNCIRLAAQPSRELFATGLEHSRKLCIVDYNLDVKQELELHSNCGSLSELSWLSDAALLATSSGGIQGWICTPGNSRPSLILGRSIGLISARPSSDHSTLAAGSRDGVVYLWSIEEGNHQQGEEPLSAELRSTLKDYSGQVNLLRWDKAGRYLATMDGSDATIWDVPKLFQQTVQSSICCGHDPQSHILCASFQDDGPLLATGGSDGKVLFYDSSSFQGGTVCQPCAAAQHIPPDDGVKCISWLPGGHLVAGTDSGKIIGWQLQLAASDESPPSPVSERTSFEADASASRAAKEAGKDPVELAMNGFTKLSIPKVAPKASRPEAAGLSSHGGRFPSRGSGRMLRESSSGSIHGEKNSGGSLNTRSARELGEKVQGDSHQESGVDIAESSRSTSLQDGSAQGLSRRTTSLERQQLSPSLMQHIQRVQQKPTASNRQREPAGWGMGSPAVPSSASTQMQYAGASNVMPFNAAHLPGAMPPGFMMFPNQASMAPQGMMPAYGFPPTMAPMPMMAHSAAPHQSMVGSSPLSSLPGMVYMPVGASPVPQQQWQMLQGPWMGHYYLQPHQRVPEHMNVVSQGRSVSLPDGPLAYDWASRPMHASEIDAAAPGGPSLKEQLAPGCLAKPALSLPNTIDSEWRGHQGRGQVRVGEKGESHQPSVMVSEPSTATIPPGGLKRRGSLNTSEAGPTMGHGSQRNSRDSKEGRSSGESQRWGDSHNLWTSPTGGVKLAAREDSIPEPTEAVDPSSPTVTVYVGNLPPTVDEVALMVPFSYFGSVSNIQVIRDKNSLQSRGFAFVSYAQPISAATAIQNMNGRILYGSFKGRALKVGPSNRVI